jgi:osmotically-inducible protein OsmY
LKGGRPKLYHSFVKLLSLLALCSCLVVSGCAGPKLTEAELSDPGIKARVEERLKADRTLDLRYVTLAVHNAYVTISGTVPSWENKRDIERTARRVKGVDQVMCNLIITE